MPNLPPNHKPPAAAPKHERPGANENWGKGRGGRRWERLREKVFRRDGYLCQPCRRAGLVTSVPLHGKRSGICGHKVPVHLGGTDAMDNLETECRTCAAAKTAREAAGTRAPVIA
jgi:5-methylcytosine-specific restriction protein A